MDSIGKHEAPGYVYHPSEDEHRLVERIFGMTAEADTRIIRGETASVGELLQNAKALLESADLARLDEKVRQRVRGTIDYVSSRVH